MELDSPFIPVEKKIPLSIRFIKGIAVFKTSLFLLILILFWVVKDADPNEGGVLSGIQYAYSNRFDINFNGSTGYEFGKLFGTVFFPLLLVVLIYNSVKDRSFKFALVTCILDILIGFAGGLPILSIVMICLLLSKSSKAYFKKDVAPVAN